MATFEVDVDVSDILNELSDREKNQMYEELKEDLGNEEALLIEDLFNNGTTYMEREIGQALAKLWESRNMLTNSQRARIIEMTTESFVE
jgi:hypoxanthine-guanine phosphoribosyltransferase